MKWAKYSKDALALECDDEAYDVAVDNLAFNDDIRILHGTMGVAGEAGELLDHIKKHVFYGKPLDRAHVVGELGDIMWYFNLVLDSVDISMDEVLDKNIQKLQNRYGGKAFSSYDEMNRDEIKEKQIMEKKT